MLTDLRAIVDSALIVGAVALAGCSSSNDSSTEGGCSGNEAGCSGAEVAPGDPQTPPTGTAASITAWLATGDYKAWTCESAPHAQRNSSPHGRNRICSNALLSGNNAAEYPVGAAGVKELYGDGATPTGYAVYRKMEAGKGGAGWYWFEVIGTQTVANGLGVSGTEKGVCVGCHAKAPKDHVFTQVK